MIMYGNQKYIAYIVYSIGTIEIVQYRMLELYNLAPGLPGRKH